MGVENDSNLVEFWVKKDPVRWFAGAISGLFAGVVALLAAMILSTQGDGDPWIVAKLAALPWNDRALEFAAPNSVVFTGILIHEGFCVFLGVIFAHFTGTNSIPALLGMGVAWGLFSWIFINNLFTPSFHDVAVAGVPKWPALLICLVFGVSLTSVSVFDRVFRGGSR